MSYGINCLHIVVSVYSNPSILDSWLKTRNL